jgi:hypothetical protein
MGPWDLGPRTGPQETLANSIVLRGWLVGASGFEPPTTCTPTGGKGARSGLYALLLALRSTGAGPSALRTGPRTGLGQSVGCGVDSGLELWSRTRPGRARRGPGAPRVRSQRAGANRCRLPPRALEATARPRHAGEEASIAREAPAPPRASTAELPPKTPRIKRRGTVLCMASCTGGTKR